jgi:hypothetical protein
MIGMDMNVLPFVAKMRRCITATLVDMDSRMVSCRKEVKT